jgi:RHS repeat-associated protein
MENDDELKGIGNSYDFGARMLDPRVGRWFAPDPILHPDYSAYSYVVNNPLVFVDPDGKDNIIYIVLLPSALNHLTLEDLQTIKDEANAILKSYGLETQIKFYNPNAGGEFHSVYLDATDTYVVFGETSDIVKQFGKNTNNYTRSIHISDIKNPEIFELADGSGFGQGAIIKTDLLDELSTSLKTNKIKAAKYLLLHSVGHNAGMGLDLIPGSGDHKKNVNGLNNFVEVNKNTLVLEAGTIARSIDPSNLSTDYNNKLLKRDKRIITIEDVFKIENNLTFVKRMIERFGKNKPKSNYASKKKEIGPVKEDGTF